MVDLLRRRYEYTVLEFADKTLSDEDREEIQNELDYNGQFGWEIVSSHYVPHSGKGYLDAPDFEYKGFERYVLKRIK